MILYSFVSYVPGSPVPMVVQSKACTVFDHPNTGITGLNPAKGMDVCPRFSALCYPV